MRGRFIAALAGAGLGPCAVVLISAGAISCGDQSFTGASDAGNDGTVDAASDSRSDAPPHPDAAGDGANGSDAGDAGDGAVQEDAPAESGVECDSAAALVCSGECVDPTDPAHCGSCTNACAAPPSGNGQATCSASAEAGAPACGIACNSGYHACNGDCLANSDDPSMDACVLTEAFGVFVSPGGSDGAGCGTRAMACATIGHAMDVAKTMSLGRVYACGSAGSYTENLVVGTSPNRDGLSVYGGLDCSNAATWTYNANKPAVVAPTAAGYALEVSGVSTGVMFEDMSFQAADAATAGASSIAVFVTGAQGAVLKNVSVTAGAGMAGGTGTTGSNYSGTAQAGAASSGANGGGGGLASCIDGSNSLGGAGGAGVTGSAGNGLNGTWTPAGTTTTGQDGKGGTGGTLVCASNADPGANGVGGNAGTTASDAGTLDALGWHPAAGGSGTNGLPGQGGAGGGGTTSPASGGSGGGAGGCGGAAGIGGAGGGSSIAVLIFGSTLTLNACTLTTGVAGNGGNGGGGQAGQAGGSRALATCTGGFGGNGGGGGGGSGGAGGVSVGVLYSSSSALTQMSTNWAGVTGGAAAGNGGPLGSGGVPGMNGLPTGSSGGSGSTGLDGVAVATLSVP